METINNKDFLQKIKNNKSNILIFGRSRYRRTYNCARIYGKEKGG